MSVEALHSFWSTSSQNRQLSIGAGSVIVLVGVALIAVGERLDWGWTRIVGAGVISLAAAYVGALVGWSDPVRPRVADLFSSWSRAILLVLTLIMVAPMFVGLLMLLGGVVVGGVTAAWYLILIGLLIAVALLAMALVTVVLAYSLADRGLWRTSPDSDSVSGEEADL